MNNSIDNLKKKILYRSNYRSTKEMDNLIGKFVKSIIDDLDIAELYNLENLLNIDDDILLRFYNNEASKLKIDENFVTKSFRKFKMKK